MSPTILQVAPAVAASMTYRGSVMDRPIEVCVGRAARTRRSQAELGFGVPMNDSHTCGTFATLTHARWGRRFASSVDSEVGSHATFWELV